MPKRKAPKPPAQWLHHVNARTFPYGPRCLYRYLCSFPSRKCWLYNYRLALQFHVSVRSIQYWLKWLKDSNLVGLVYPRSSGVTFDGYARNGPRIIKVHHFRHAPQWIVARTARRLARLTRKKPLAPVDFEASRNRQKAALGF